MGTAPSHLVVDAVAGEEGVSPTDLSPPLSDVIDIEALDALFGVPGKEEYGPMEVAFEYQGYQIIIAGSDVSDLTVHVAPGDGGGSEQP